MNKLHLLGDDLEFVITVGEADLPVVNRAIANFFSVTAGDWSKIMKLEHVVTSPDSCASVELAVTAQ